MASTSTHSCTVRKRSQKKEISDKNHDITMTDPTKIEMKKVQKRYKKRYIF